MISEFVNSLSKFLPEILICAAIFIITLEGILPKVKPGILFYSVVTGMGIILIFTYAQQSLPAQKLFFEMTVIDPFAIFLKMLIGISVLFVICFSAVSHDTSNHNKNSAEYYILILGLVLGGFLLVSSINLLMIYLSIELMNVCSYLLSGFIKESKRSSEASLNHALYGGVSSALMLFGISLLFGLCGSADLYSISNFLSANAVNTTNLLVSVLLLLAGLCYKVTVFPAYFTATDVYEDSSLPVSALFSTVVFISGFGVLTRFFLTAFHIPVSTIVNFSIYNLIQGFKWYSIISFVAIITIIFASFAVLWQENIKRLLAFLSIAQAGYILLGITVANPIGLTSAMFSLAVLTFTNLGAFFCLILISNKYKTVNIHSIKGLIHNSPFLTACFCVFLLSMAGFPLTAGFIGRFLVMTSLFNSGYLLLVVMVLLNSIINLYCISKIIKNILFLEPFISQPKFTLSNAENYILLILLIPAILLGIYFTPLLNWAEFSTNILGL